MSAPVLMTCAELAAVAKLDVATIRRYVQSCGLIPDARTTKGAPLFWRDSLEKHVRAAQKTKEVLALQAVLARGEQARERNRERRVGIKTLTPFVKDGAMPEEMDP